MLLIPQLAQWSHWLLKNKATTLLKLTTRMKLLCAIRKPQWRRSTAIKGRTTRASTFLVSAENAPFLQQVSHDTTRPLSDYLIKSYIHLRHDSKINYSASTSRPSQRPIPPSAQPPWTSRAAQWTDRTRAQTLTWFESGQGVDSQGWSTSPRWTTYRQFWGWSTVEGMRVRTFQ